MLKGMASYLHNPMSKQNTVPRYIGVLAEANPQVRWSYFTSNSVDELLGIMRADIQRVLSGKTASNELPAFVAAHGVVGKPIECRGSNDRFVLQREYATKWAESIVAYEAAGGDKTDGGSPWWDLYEPDDKQESGQCWRIYTESLRY